MSPLAAPGAPPAVAALERWCRHFRAGTETDLEIAAWLDEWAESCGLVESLDFDGVSLWWFARFHLLKQLWDLLPDVRALDAALDEVGRGPVPMPHYSAHWQRVVDAVGRRRDLSLLAVEADRRPVRSVHRLLDRLGTAAVRLMRGAASMRRHARAPRRAEVLATSYSVCKRIQYGDRVRFMEPTFEPLLDELTRRGRGVFKFNVPTANGWRNDLRWLRQADRTAVPVEFPLLAWLLRSGWRDREPAVTRVLGALPEILRRIDAVPARWHEFDLAPELRALCRSVLVPRVRRAIREIRFFRDWSRRTCPRVLVLSNEYSGVALAATVAARQLGIPVVALQHGVIWRAHPGYILPRERLSTIPRANHICVFGAFERDLVVTHGVYTPDEVTVVGSPRMDLLVRQGSSLTREELARRLNLRPEAPIVLFTSTGESWMLARRLADGLAASTEPVSVIVKVHPTGEADPAAFAAVAAERKLDTVRVVNEEIDLYELLRLVDVHMSMNSTVLTEATAFGLPNIMLATESAADKVGYLARDVAVRAEDYPSLAAAVVDVLHGPAAARLRAGRPAFVERQFYRIDGGATARAADVVERVLAGRA